MIPILYEKDETNFASNGLGRLRDTISCVVTEERNGIYECDFSYPISGANYDKIQCGRIIGVTHDESGDIQPFDIVSYSRPIDGVVTFHAVHISYRQGKMVTYGSGVYSLSAAFTRFDDVFFPDNPLGLDIGGNPFTYVTDKTSTGYCAAFDGTPRTIRSLLGGVEGSILDTYGGEYEWDKWIVRLHSARGVQRNFSIRYGVNMTKFQDDTDYSESYNTCVPYWLDSSTGAIVRGGEVSSGQGSIGAGNRCIPLNLTDKFASRPTVAQLNSMAVAVMNANQPYLPSQNITVDFVRLQDEAGFDEFDTLLQCKLCDSVKVTFPHYDMSAYYKIVKTVWDVLLDRYEKMELGNLSTSLAEALGINTSTGTPKPGGEQGYRTLLYTNSSPSSAMSATTLVASGADMYDEIEVLFKTAHVYDGYQSVKAPYISGAHITLLAPTGSTGEFQGVIMNGVRTITMTSAGGLYANNAITMGTSGTSTNNNMCIPYKIYGIKYA